MPWSLANTCQLLKMYLSPPRFTWQLNLQRQRINPDELYDNNRKAGDALSPQDVETLAQTQATDHHSRKGN